MGYIEIGTTPYEEECAQVGELDYYEKVNEESIRYIALLREIFGDETEHDCLYVRKSFPHDFGTYYEVCIKFYDTDRGNEFAYFVEENLPATWDMKKEDYDPFPWDNAG